MMLAPSCRLLLGPFRLLSLAPGCLDSWIGCSCARARVRAFLALASIATQPVRVLRRVLVPGRAVRPARSPAVVVDFLCYRFPVRGVLAGAMLARDAGRAVPVASVAKVVNDLAWLKGAHEHGESESVRPYPPTLTVRERPVVAFIARRRPRPAFIRPALINLGLVPPEPRRSLR